MVSRARRVTGSRLSSRSLEFDRSAGRRGKPHQNPCESRLAAAGLADDGHGLAAPGVEGQAIVGCHMPVPLGEVFHLDHRLAEARRGSFDPGRCGGLPRDLPDSAGSGTRERRGVEFLHGNRARIAAPAGKESAARPKIAARRAGLRRRQLARYRLQRAAVLVRTRHGNGGEKTARVRMARAAKHGRHRADLHRFSRIHDGHPIAGLADQSQIVRYVQHGRAELGGNIADQIHDARLHRHVERGGGFIQQQQLRIRQQCHGDDDPLLLAAGNLVRVGAHDAFAVRHAHPVEHPARAHPGVPPFPRPHDTSALPSAARRRSSTDSARPSAPDRSSRSGRRESAAIPRRSRPRGRALETESGLPTTRPALPRWRMTASATVDLPQPDSPTRPCASPRITTRLKSTTAGTSPARPA